MPKGKEFDRPVLKPVFWRSFRQRYWEREGVVLRHPIGAPLAKPEELFAWLVEASNRFRAGDSRVVPEFFIEHAQLLAGVERYLPRSDDGSMSGYADRITQVLDGRKFGLVIDHFQSHALDLWLRLRDFLRSLYGVTGFPGEQAKAALFLGNYRRTPFGLHRGRSGNFMFVVHGRKRIRSWPDAFFKGKPDMTNRLDYARYNGDSITLDADPGDVIYWPSDYWHIGEDAGGLSAAISLALFMEPDLSEIMRHVEFFMGRRISGRAPLVDEQPKVTVSALKAVSRDRNLKLALIASRLNYLTGFGFTRVPAPLLLKTLHENDLVGIVPGFPILWIAKAGEIICSANGHAITLPAHPKVSALLRRLNSGARCRVKELVAEYSGTVRRNGVEFIASRKAVFDLLEKLHSFRALAPCKPGVVPR